MITEFSIKNFRSIKNLQTVNFNATSQKSTEENRIVDENNVIDTENGKLLKTIGIYGGNGSGKSNVVKALMLFLDLIKRDVSSDSHLDKLCQPFLLDEQSVSDDTFFQVILLIDKKKYRYGFTAKKNPISSTEENEQPLHIITSEWLFGVKESNKNMTSFFIRKNNEVDYSNLEDNQLIPSPLENNHNLFLTRASAYIQGGVCNDIRSYLGNWTTSNLSDDHQNFRKLSLRYLSDDEKKVKFLKLLSAFNIHYGDIELLEDKINYQNKVYPQNKIKIKKSFNNTNGESVDVFLNLYEHESDGTKKMFDLAGLLLVTFGLNKPGFVCLDEVDSNFHSFLLIKLIDMFNDPMINRSNSQLLFSSHDTNLMSPKLMRRDQFYLTEKMTDNSTELYSLANLKGVRNSIDFAKHYLAGHFGGVPILEKYITE
jgi:AAA15 family ATPase/GTPase